MGTVAGRMEIVVHGRNVVVPDHFRVHVAEKLDKIERYDHKIIRTDVELYHERNPRQGGSCQRIEITCRTRGPVVRAEATAGDFYAALDKAAEKLSRRFSRAADRRRVHHGRRTPSSIAEVAAMNGTATFGPGTLSGAVALAEAPSVEDESGPYAGPGQVVREKQHTGEPMTVEQAMYEMELVGHDFYLFRCSETGQASVVYRRHAYDYGLIRLGE